MGMRPEVESLEQRAGYRFRDRAILECALTHSSHVHEKAVAKTAADGLEAPRDNEQLEFLGDAVLGFLISESLVARFPAYREGRLSKLKAHLVSANHLLGAAQRIELGQYLQLGRGEEMSGGRLKRTLLVDALEALIAAVYLDGGIEAARRFVCHCVIGDANGGLEALEDALPEQVLDFKSALQELAQARKLPQPRYIIIKERGPEHSKTFTIEVRVGKEWISQADGLTKKSAAQKAARTVYEKLVSGPNPDAAPS